MIIPWNGVCGKVFITAIGKIRNGKNDGVKLTFFIKTRTQNFVFFYNKAVTKLDRGRDIDATAFKHLAYPIHISPSCRK